MEEYEIMRQRLLSSLGADPENRQPLMNLAVLYAQQLRRFHADGPSASYMVEFARYIDENLSSKAKEHNNIKGS